MKKKNVGKHYKEISLCREINVSCIRVIGEVARGQKREEILAVLKRIDEVGRAKVNDISEHLLFDSVGRSVVAKRLLGITESHRLTRRFDNTYELTDLGRIALDQHEIMVPEKGEWNIWFSEDPLLEHPIILVESRGNQTYGKADNATTPCKVPEWCHQWVDERIRPLTGAEDIVIQEVEGNARAVEVDERLNLAWEPEGGVTVSGSVNGVSVQANLNGPSNTFDSVWQELIGASQTDGTYWDADNNVLRTPFVALSDQEKQTFQTVVNFGSPEVEDFGRFNSVSVKSVPISSATQEDASLWANWRLMQRVLGYATEERYVQWQHDAVGPLKDEKPKVEERPIAALTSWKNRLNDNSRAWHLMAAEDWRL